MPAAPASAAASPLLEDDSDVVGAEVRQTISEDITGAPAPYGAWNGHFGWESRFRLNLDPSAHTITIAMRLFSSASAETKQRWETAIEARWGGRYSLVVAGADAAAAPERYRILCDLTWTDAAGDAHYTINPQTPGSGGGGIEGLGGTKSMIDWGVNDTTDVTHEFGHMLGMPEDYFVTNGVNHMAGGATGFRDHNGGIMNNPADDPFTQHYELIRTRSASLLGVAASRCSVQ